MHAKHRQRLTQNLNFLAKNSPAAHQNYLSIADRDCALIYPDHDPMAPTNFIYQDSLFYPIDAKPYAIGHVAHHLEHVTPFKMPVLLFDHDDPIIFKHIMSIEDELGVTVFHQPKLAFHVPKDFCPTIFVFGLGLRYTVDELLHQLGPCNIILLETDAKIFTAFLASADLKEISARLSRRSGHLSCHFNADPGACLQGAFDRAQMIPTAQLNCFHAFVGHNRNAMQTVIDNFTKFAPRVLAGLSGYFNDERRQIVQTYENLLATKRILHDKFEPLDGATAVVIGSGPSLDQSIEKLTALKDRTVIFACGSAMPPLLKKGIIPDFYVELETHPVTLDYVRLVEEFDVHHKTIFLGSTGVPPDAFIPWAQKLLFVRDRSTSSLLLEPEFKAIKASWPMVGNAGVAIAAALGFRQILLMGLDCGSRQGQRHHAKESSYYDGKAKEIGEANPISSLENIDGELREAVTDIEKQSIFEIPSVKGDVVIAHYMLWYSHLYLENFFRENSNINAVQISDGAMISGAINLLPSAFDPMTIGSERKDIVQRILARIVPSDGIDVKYIEAVRKIGAEGEQISRILSRHFERPVKSFADWMKYIGDANNGIERYRNQNSHALSLIFGSYEKVTKALTERAHMIDDDALRLRFLQTGAGRVRSILSDMAQSLVNLVPELENLKLRRLP